jgi:hypothetical protein
MNNMNGPAGQSGRLELPAPVVESLPNGTEVDSASPNVAPSAPEKATQPQPPANLQITPPANPAVKLPLPPVVPVTGSKTDVSSTSNSGKTTGTDDSDLIEKEWVNKAKQIVEKTRDDPYKQSQELTVVKADYMKKHYNKTIKLNK